MKHPARSARSHRARVGAIASLVLVLARPGFAATETPDLDTRVLPPIGVLGEGVRGEGQVTLSYRYHRLSQQGLMVGDSEVSLGMVAAQYSYAVLPTSLDVNSHLIEVMWTPTDTLSLVMSLPFIEKTMEQVLLSTSQSFSTTARGFGDLGLAVLYQVHDAEKGRVLLNLGLSVPTGSTNVTDQTIANQDTLERLPYAMQLGSGTVDLRPGVTYQGFWGGTNWGGQMMGVLHAGTNSRGYKLGNRYLVTGWLARRWVPWLNTSFRLEWQQWFPIEGQDEVLASSTSDFSNSPANDPANLAGRRLDALFGFDVYVRKGKLAGTRISLEGGLPAYQSLDGPQLGTEWVLTVGVQYSF